MMSLVASRTTTGTRGYSRRLSCAKKKMNLKPRTLIKKPKELL